MWRSNGAPRASLDIAVVIKAPPAVIVRAFFDPDALGAWWSTVRSVTTPRTLGAYAVEWPPTEFRDDVLGRLGGIFRGTVLEFDPGRGFLLSDAFWLPPDTDPIGPMALEVSCTSVTPTDSSTSAADTATEVRVVQSGYEDSIRWQRYYEIVAAGWEGALYSMKRLLEK